MKVGESAGRVVAAGLVLLALFGGCSSVAPPTAPSAERPPPVPAAPADRRAAQPAAVVAERQWLQSWFEGTPVSIALRGERMITVDVPTEFCFDPGRTRVKPALAAVLDKVAQSMRRLPYSGLSLIAAPNDAAGNRLGLQRAAQIRRHLRSAGVPAAKLGQPSATTAAAVQLRIDVEEP